MFPSLNAIIMTHCFQHSAAKMAFRPSEVPPPPPLTLLSKNQTFVWLLSSLQEFPLWTFPQNRMSRETPAASFCQTKWCPTITINTALHSTALNETAPHCTVLLCSSPHCTKLHYMALHCIAMHYIALHCTALHCTVLLCSSLHCTKLHYTRLHCTALHCTALHFFTHDYNPPVAPGCVTLPQPPGSTALWGKKGSNEPNIY